MEPFVATYPGISIAFRLRKKWADKKRRPVEYSEGDQVMVKLLPNQFKALRQMRIG